MMKILRTVSSLALASLPFGLGLFLAAAPAAVDDGAKDDAVRESVVKVSATMRNAEPFKPWSKSSPHDASGTGVVIEGKRILTNAHVVLYASQLFVESNQSSDKIAATVEAVSPGIDLAVLKLEDESFFDRRPPIPRVKDLPEIKETVLTYGYPQGGSSLSITKGIVSRIEFAPYHEHTSGLRIQVDAAINPGNSGGPALVGDKMVGLVFSRLNSADNIGYIIPSEEIDLFLKDVADGRYDGKPAMYDQLQTLENDALRGMLKLDKKAAGMVVHRPDRDDPSYPLKEWDLITKIGDHEIDNTGKVRVKGGLRLQFHYLIQELTKNGKVPLTIIRKGETKSVELPVSAKHPMLVEGLSGRYPSYFVYGPLVFSPVTTDFMALFDRMAGGTYPGLALMRSPLVRRRGDRPGFDGEQLVAVAAPMFPHRLSKGYSNPWTKVVKEVNGVRVKNLRHLVETLRDAKDKYVTISFDDRASETIVFDRKEVLAATDEILSDNGIRQQASDELAEVWKKK
jgi:S1-C subfamily serine protease